MSILVISPYTETLGIKNWPILTNDSSSFFYWTYDDKKTYLLLEGEVTVTTEGKESVKFGAGYLVVFPSGVDSK